MKKESSQTKVKRKAAASPDLFSKIAEKSQCAILITCKPQLKGGSLDIEMTYSGEDPYLASLMMEQAQERFEQDILSLAAPSPDDRFE